MSPTPEDRRILWSSEDDSLILSSGPPRPRLDLRTRTQSRIGTEAAHRFALALAEVLAGQRPPVQLLSMSNSMSVGEVIRTLEKWPLTGARLHCLHLGDAVTQNSFEAVACYGWRPGGGHAARLMFVTYRMVRVKGTWRCRDLRVGVPNIDRF